MKEGNLKYKWSFLIISYVALVELFLLPYDEISRLVIGLMFVSLIVFVHSLVFIKYWVWIFYISCFSFVLIGQHFNPNYHFPVIQFMFISAIIFEGFPVIPTLLMGLYLLRYVLYPIENVAVYNAVFSSWIVSVLLERYVSRVKNREISLDKKLRYKGIQTDFFIHDLKNRLQIIITQPAETRDFQDIISRIQAFNSISSYEVITFKEIVQKTQVKCKVLADISVSGSDDFFIDQMDLETLLCSLMKTSQSNCKDTAVKLKIYIKNKKIGFVYEDNAGEISDELLRLLSQKDGQYVSEEKSGYGLFLAKKLVEHQGGKFTAKKAATGTRYEISY